MVLGGRIINKIYFYPYFLNSFPCFCVTFIRRRKLLQKPKKKRGRNWEWLSHVEVDRTLWMASSHVWWIQFLTALLYLLCVRRWAVPWNGPFPAYVNHFALENTAYQSSFYLFNIICHFSKSNCIFNFIISLTWLDRAQRKREKDGLIFC